VIFNKSKRTSLAKHAAGEIAAAGLPRLDAELSDRVAYGEMTFPGRLPAGGPAADEVAALIAELRALGWISPRNAVETAPRKGVAA